MKAITLRNIPPELQEELEKEAAETHSSLNKTVLRLLLQATGIPAETVSSERHDDLDFLAGTWSDEEASRFEAALEEQRTIDPESWGSG